MSIFICSDLFEHRGEQWNTPNYQHPASRKFRSRQPDGTYAPLEKEDISGYEPVSLSPTRAVEKPRYVDPKPSGTSADARLRCNRVMQAKAALRKSVWEKRHATR